MDISSQFHSFGVNDVSNQRQRIKLCLPPQGRIMSTSIRKNVVPGNVILPVTLNLKHFDFFLENRVAFFFLP